MTCRRFTRNFAACGFIFMLAATGHSAAAAEPDYAAINARVIQDHALPRYRAFTAAAAGLVKATKNLCPGVSAAGLAHVREAFHGAYDSWQEVEHLRQGPAGKIEAHIRVKFWPDRRNLVGRHLRRTLAGDDAAILQPEAFAATSIAVQGFPALEQLLFLKDAESRLKSTEGPVTPCMVTQAIAINLHNIARNLEDMWTKDPAGGRPAKRVTTDLFNDLATGFGAVADLKLGGPLGSNGKTRPRHAESHLSGRSLRNLVVNLMALEDLYVSLAPSSGTNDGSADDDMAVRRRFEEVIAEAKFLGPSITTALESPVGVEKIAALKTSVKDLTKAVMLKVSGDLGLVLGFNALDGD